MKEHIDKYWVGIVLGLLAPTVFGYVYIEQFGLWPLFQDMGAWSSSACSAAISKLLQLSLFPDMAMVFLFYTMDCWKVSKGLVVGLLPFLIAALYFTI